jgi:exodeoxyribonuclease VII large subunit
MTQLMLEEVDTGGPPVLSVGEFVEQLRDFFDTEVGEVLIEGEVGSLHRSRPGHLYFDLKDDDAQLRCAMFRRSAQRLNFDPEEGMRVRARGRLDLYPARGTLQLIVEELKPAGEGELRAAFERLKQTLLAEGLFEPEHKQPLPSWPKRIGLVTSLAGAAVHDFLRGLRRRGAGVDVVVFDARVQGEGAWRELTRGLQAFDAREDIDVIVLARGGGSLEDLWNFNAEPLVRAVFAAETPVVSAIGHEVDFVLTDGVADVRAATPTAAAELVVPDSLEFQRTIAALESRLLRSQRHQLEQLASRVEVLRRGLVHPARRLAELGRRTAQARLRLVAATRAAHAHADARVGAASGRLARASRAAIERRRARLGALGGRLDALSPLAVLGRGYAIARGEAGGILRDASDVRSGEAVDVRLARGRIEATVTAVHPEDEPTGVEE